MRNSKTGFSTPHSVARRKRSDAHVNTSLIGSSRMSTTGSRTGGNPSNGGSGEMAGGDGTLSSGGGGRMAGGDGTPSSGGSGRIEVGGGTPSSGGSPLMAHPRRGR